MVKLILKIIIYWEQNDTVLKNEILSSFFLSIHQNITSVRITCNTLLAKVFGNVLQSFNRKKLFKQKVWESSAVHKSLQSSLKHHPIIMQ